MEASILKKAENLDRLGYEGYVDSKSKLDDQLLNMLMDQIQNNNNDNIKNPSYRVILLVGPIFLCDIDPMICSHRYMRS